MILERVIKKPNIKSEYKEFVDSFKSQLLNEFGDKIHSIYMCGSIPKGTAIPYKSDADFTILCEKSKDIDRCKLTSLKEKVLKKFPLVTKIDATVCTLDDVRNYPNEWGFWVKIICVNIYGIDFGEIIPPIAITQQFILDLNSEAKHAITRVSDALMKTTDNHKKCMYIKGYSKRLIRMLYSLILIDVGVWQDNILEMKKSIILFSDIKPTLVEYLYNSYMNSDIAVNDFKEKADEVYSYYEHGLDTLSAY